MLPPLELEPPVSPLVLSSLLPHPAATTARRRTRLATEIRFDINSFFLD
jgi:hypothetical protein